MTMSFSPMCFSRLVVFLAALFLAVPVSADIPQRKVTVVGNAIIKVVPDEMHWTVQISIDAATLAKAKGRHDSSMTDVLKFLKGQGSALKDLQTGGIRIQKNNYAPPDSPAAKTPFNCSTQFTFTLTDFDKYGPLCDGLAKLDGVQVQGVDYAYSKSESVKRDALKQALQNAKDKANDLAVTAGCYIDKPLSIEEGATSDGPRPMPMMMKAAFADGGTPGAVAGQIEISAAVTATYDLYYK